MTLPLSRAQSRQRHNTENDLRRPRASIRDLQQLIDTSLNSYSSPLVPARLLSSINHCAILEDQSNLSNEMYESVVQDMVSFMSSTIASFGKSFESEGVYNPELLNMYDALVWGFNSPFLWRITQNDISSLYRKNASHNHCEIAVGTGLFLSEVIPSMNNITLLDLNVNCLRVCEERIKAVYRQNRLNKDDNMASLPAVSKLLVDIMMIMPSQRNDAVHEDGGFRLDHPPSSQSSPLTTFRGKFQSVGANFLFHCLHGSGLYDKIHAFRNCASLVHPKEGVFFGSTILGKEMLEDETNAGETAMRVLRDFNTVGVFGNMGDSLKDLEDILLDMFEDVDVSRIGYCGVWSARLPRTTRR